DGTHRTDIPNGGTYRIVDILKDDPANILVWRSIDTAFLSKMRVRDGDVRTVATAPITYGTFLVGHNGEVRYAFGQEENNETITLRRDGGSWTEVHSDPMGGSKRLPLAMAADDKHAIVAVSEEGEPARLMLVDPENGKESL